MQAWAGRGRLFLGVLGLKSGVPVRNLRVERLEVSV